MRTEAVKANQGQTTGQMTCTLEHRAPGNSVQASFTLEVSPEVGRKRPDDRPCRLIGQIALLMVESR